MTKQELMEVSNETLAVYAAMVEDEKKRRRLNTEAVTVHAGNIAGGQPISLLVRVLKKVGASPPADLQKVEALLDGFASSRT